MNKEPLYNKIRRWFWGCVPLGVVVYMFQRYSNPSDNMGKTIWSRVYSNYSDEYKGAVVLIRKLEKDK